MLRLLASHADRFLASEILASLNHEAELAALLLVDEHSELGTTRTAVAVEDTIVALWTPRSCGNHTMHEIAGAAFGRSALISLICGKVELPVVISMVQHIELDERSPQLHGLAESLKRAQVFLRNPLTTVGDGAPYVFISYARRDVAQIEPILSFLADLGIPYWLDRNIVAGTWSDEIDRHLNGCAAVLVVWTENACNSHWVAAEAAYAYQDKKLVGLRLSDCRPQAHLRLAASDAVRKVEDLVPHLAAFLKSPKLELLTDASKFVSFLSTQYYSERAKQLELDRGRSIQKRFSRLVLSGEYAEKVQAQLHAAVDAVDKALVHTIVSDRSPPPVYVALEPTWKTEVWASLGVMSVLAASVATVVFTLL